MTESTERHEHRRLALEHLALDAVGMLSSSRDSEDWVRDHLATGCAICCGAARDVGGLTDDLLLAAPPVEPRSGLRADVLRSVTSKSAASGPVLAGPEFCDEEPSPAASDVQVWRRWTVDSESKFYTLPAEAGGWEAIGIEGISVRELHVDVEADTITMMVRMAPGTSYPRHRHAGDEQCFVLSGDLQVEDSVLGAGDYQFAPVGSMHGVQSTSGGCTLLIISSRSDELADESAD